MRRFGGGSGRECRKDSRQVPHLPRPWVSRPPPGGEDIGRSAILEDSARANEPAADTGIVIGARQIADHQRQHVKTGGNVVWSYAGAGLIPAQAHHRDVQQASEQIGSQHTIQRRPLRCRYGRHIHRDNDRRVVHYPCLQVAYKIKPARPARPRGLRKYGKRSIVGPARSGRDRRAGRRCRTNRRTGASRPGTSRHGRWRGTRRRWPDSPRRVPRCRG